MSEYQHFSPELTSLRQHLHKDIHTTFDTFPIVICHSQVFNTVGKVYCVNITPHFIMGGAHNVMYIWNMISLDESPMFTLPHPG